MEFEGVFAHGQKVFGKSFSIDGKLRYIGEFQNGRPKGQGTLSGREYSTIREAFLAICPTAEGRNTARMECCIMRRVCKWLPERNG